MRVWRAEVVSACCGRLSQRKEASDNVPKDETAYGKIPRYSVARRSHLQNFVASARGRLMRCGDRLCDAPLLTSLSLARAFCQCVKGGARVAGSLDSNRDGSHFANETMTSHKNVSPLDYICRAWCLAGNCWRSFHRYKLSRGVRDVPIVKNQAN